MPRKVIRNEEGKPFSKWKATDRFSYIWKRKGLRGGAFVKELAFHPTRKWRHDFCWPEQMLAVEIDGFGYGHQSQQGTSNDNEKQNAAIELGWTVLRYSTRQLQSMDGVISAVEQVSRVLSNSREL